MAGLTIRMDSAAAERALRQAKEQFKEEALLKTIGQRLLRWVDDNFKHAGLERPWAPLSPNTIAGRRQGSSRPLMDTGRLKQSFVAFGARTSTGSVEVGTEDRRGEFHHYGTRPRVIEASRAKVLRFIVAGGRAVYRHRVNHPGIPSRPLLPTAPLAESLGLDVLEAAARRAEELTAVGGAD